MRRITSRKVYYRLIYMLRLLLWRTISGDNKSIFLRLTPTISAELVAAGDITRMLYRDQPFADRGRFFERDTLQLFVSHIKPKATIIDVGANIGLFSIVASKILQNTGKIYAFEPTAKTHQRLVRNLALNNCANVVPVAKALSDKDGAVTMVSPDDALRNGFQDAFNQIRPFQNDSPPNSSAEAATLDSFVEQNQIRQIDLIKVDIEGAELLFFRGAEKTLRMRPTIIFEFCEEHCHSFDYEAQEIIDFLHSHRYVVKQYAPHQCIATPREQQDLTSSEPEQC